MNSKLWTLCEEQKVEIRQHKQETSRLNTELVQVRYISGSDRIHFLLIVMELLTFATLALAGRQVPIFSYFFLFFSAYSYFSYFLAISSYFSYFLAILLTISKYLLEI